MAQALLPLALLAIIVGFLKVRFSKKQARLPPGPPADPLIGHLRSIPPTGQDIFFYELGRTYGDVVHLKVLNRTLIVLNSVQAASDLLDKQSSIYSSRPRFPIIELLGMGDTLAFVPYGDEFRIQRKMIQQFFTKAKAQHHYVIQTREARILASSLLFRPNDRSELLLRFSTAIIMEIGYGHQIVSNDDPYLKMADDASRATAESGPIGGTPVDLFPILKYFPSWFPGTYYATYARASSPVFKALHEVPIAHVREQMAKGSPKPSFLLSQLESLDSEDPESSDLPLIKAASAILYVAGAETTSSTLSFFFLAMVLYPKYQASAQRELDVVVGTDRLPEFHDREQMPFIECLPQETLRWNLAVPAGVPHCALEDGIYKGMFIPKGATIIPNTRGMTWDESVYRNPFAFDPTRFLPAPEGRGEPYPTAAFGFGRRVCPGRFLAEDSLWIAVATIIATLTISRARGEDGAEIIPDVVPVSTGVASHPKPFTCRLEARTATATVLLNDEVKCE